MNKERRKAIAAAISTLEQLLSDVENTRDGEQEAYDGLPESLQNGDRGEAMQSAISSLEAAIGGIETARDSLGEIE